jgi:putative molybdopterin biosynthesis protein
VAVSRWQTLRKRTPAEQERPPSAQLLRFAGSHDLSVEILAHKLVESEPECRLELKFIGSLGGLIALTSDEADVAGVHLWDASTDTYNLPYIRRVLPSQRLALVTLIHRQLGFIVPQGNPQRIKNLGDLVRPDVRWINRQMGSGTRIWLDEHLQQAEIMPTKISGYNDEGATHMAVAQAIEAGQATAGLGIQAAALAYGLNFVPLTKEVYQLVVPEAVWERPVWRTLLAIIRSDEFNAAVDNLGGYDTTATGEVIWI